MYPPLALVLALAAPAAAYITPEDMSVAEERIAEFKTVLGGMPNLAIRPGSNSSYAPYQVDCPNVTWVRPANGLGAEEQAYLDKAAGRLGAAAKALANVSTSEGRVGIALSGGGYRAMINGLGMVEGLMDSNFTSGSGNGYLDAASYLSGLSGGAWAVGALVSNGFKRPSDFVSQLELNISLIQPANPNETYASMISDAAAKNALGFPTALTDVWGLLVGQHTLPAEFRAADNRNFTLSGAFDGTFSARNASDAAWPIPILTAAGVDTPDAKEAVPTAPVYEFTPFEFGTWNINGAEGAFTPAAYLGSAIANGSSTGTCYRGYDQLSFIMGVSSTLFGSLPFNATGLFPATPAQLSSFVNASTQNVASVPNPFIAFGDSATAQREDLLLVDAGMMDINIPVQPLLVPARNVTGIIALDSSADTKYSWPNGSALHVAYQASQAGNSTRMPKIPSPNTFVNNGLNTRPTFFGCNETGVPIIAYIPNYPWTFMSNVSTFTFQFDNAKVLAQVASAKQAATLNGTAGWSTCLSCAVFGRNVSADCGKCFEAFCWDGSENDTQPAGEYEPAVGVPAFVSSLKLNVSSPAPQGNGTAPSAGGKNGAVGVGAGVWTAGMAAMGVCAMMVL